MYNPDNHSQGVFGSSRREEGERHEMCRSKMAEPSKLRQPDVNKENRSRRSRQPKTKTLTLKTKHPKGPLTSERRQRATDNRSWPVPQNQRRTPQPATLTHRSAAHVIFQIPLAPPHGSVYIHIIAQTADAQPRLWTSGPWLRSATAFRQTQTRSIWHPPHSSVS